jgi:pimeloyl-ACP methyl ester carboxylesterase
MFRIIFLLAFILLSISIVKAQTEFPAPGMLVDVNGYKIHLIKEGSGGPPVIMFHGAGHISLMWDLVIPKVAKFSTAVAVDQAGEGWSEHGHAVHMKQQAYDTYTALQNAGIKGPYILVGHSLGGILTRVFANAYPDEVAGVVLVDATHPDILLKYYNEGGAWKRSRLKAEDGVEIPEANTSQLVEKPELTSVQARRNFGDLLEKFSDEDKARFNWIYNERPFTYVKGRGSYESETFKLLFEKPQEYGFGNKPLVVISGGAKEPQQGDEQWSSAELKIHSEKLQKDLLNLSTDSRQIIAKKSGHQIHIDEPELVAKAIESVIDKLKRKK